MTIRVEVHQNMTLAPRFTENVKAACEDKRAKWGWLFSEGVFGAKPVSKFTVFECGKYTIGWG